ncbi:MAG: hypothetical protein WC725_02555 [Patescibacteria group bacterium]|jgi:hypothetical protein
MSDREPINPEEQLEVSQINRDSGLDEDFLNEINTLPFALDFFEKGSLTAEKTMKLIEDSIVSSKKGVLIKTYEQRYPNSKFKDDTREKIKQLNELVRNINAEYRSLLANDLLDANDKVLVIQKEIIPVCDQIRNLILGKT